MTIYTLLKHPRSLSVEAEGAQAAFMAWIVCWLSKGYIIGTTRYPRPYIFLHGTYDFFSSLFLTTRTNRRAKLLSGSGSCKGR
jgi:hypothetical protein